MSDYVILRDLAAAPTAAPFDLRRPRTRGTAAEPPAPKVEVARGLTPTQAGDAARAPDVVAIARLMRTALIKPVAEGTAGAAAAGDAWGIAAVGADASPRDGSGVVAAVLDTGIDASHPAFAGVTLVQRDFTGSGDGDGQGHGTHCAGTIFGRDVSGRRIGVARGVERALIGKVLDNNGSGTSEGIFAGIQWAIEQGAHVVSMSLGFDFPGMVEDLRGQGWPPTAATSAALEAYRGNLRMFDRLMEMVKAREAFGDGTIVVAAAGNESGRDAAPPFEIAASLPAAAEGVVSVGALARGSAGFSVASFSNTFPQVAAPGVGILSAKAGGGFVELNGTSMACPHVAGVACLWWQEVRAAGLVTPNAFAVLARLLSSARPNVFAGGVDAADRGLGLITAPQ
jgi:subtilisin family serine protease